MPLCHENALTDPFRSCAKCGQPALWSVDIYTEQEQFKHILQHLSTDLQLQLRLSNTMARAQRTFVQFASPELSKQQERTLDSVIQMLTSQLDTIEHNTSSGKDGVDQVYLWY